MVQEDTAHEQGTDAWEEEDIHFAWPRKARLRPPDQGAVSTGPWTEAPRSQGQKCKQRMLLTVWEAGLTLRAPCLNQGFAKALRGPVYFFMILFFF